METRKNFIIAGVVGLVVVIGLVFWFSKDVENNKETPNETATGVAGDPRDITLDFYEAWKSARESTSTDPYKEKLTKQDMIGVELKKKLSDAESAFREKNEDPVFCQSNIPDRFRVKSVYTNSDSAQLLVTPKDNELGIQALVTLSAQNDLWIIKDISCSKGETAPEEGEFNFEREGFLLQKSAQPPLDPKDWHLVFEQDGVLGYFVPIFFSEESVCISEDGKEETCDVTKLGETMKVKVQGGMKEAGVDVKRLQFLK